MIKIIIKNIFSFKTLIILIVLGLIGILSINLFSYTELIAELIGTAISVIIIDNIINYNAYLKDKQMKIILNKKIITTIKTLEDLLSKLGNLENLDTINLDDFKESLRQNMNLENPIPNMQPSQNLGKYSLGQIGYFINTGKMIVQNYMVRFSTDLFIKYDLLLNNPSGIKVLEGLLITYNNERIDTHIKDALKAEGSKAVFIKHICQIFQDIESLKKSLKDK